MRSAGVMRVALRVTRVHAAIQRWRRVTSELSNGAIRPRMCVRGGLLSGGLNGADECLHDQAEGHEV
jgi:hypothetical protein